MAADHETIKKSATWLGIGAVLAAIGASACCVGPLLLLSLGMGGAWMSTLTSMETIRPFFFIITLIFIGLSFRKLYLIPENCDQGEICAISEVKKRQRIIFWIASILIVMLLTFPWYAPYFL